MIYLDNAATTGKKPESVIQAVNEAMVNLSVNAGRGSYASARKAAQVMDECRNNLLKVGKITSGYHAYFLPSATIALNQLILGLELDQYSTVYASPFEHNAVMRPLNAMCRKTGARTEILPFVRQTWKLDAEETESMFLTQRPDYIFISMVSNTTGYILPVEEIVRAAHEYGAKVIVDCAQAFGAIDISFEKIDADAYVFAGHKTLYGPYGIAGLIIKDSFQMIPGLYGGTGSDSLNLEMPTPHAGGYEPGSANVSAICGLNAALKWIESVGVENIQEHEKKLITYFEERVQKCERIKLFLPPTDCRSSIVAFAVEGYQSHEVGEILDDEFQIAVRTGYQCAPLVHDWLGTKPYAGIVRMSVGFFNTVDDVIQIAEAIKTL